jgi:hypothetical protein
MWNKIKCAFRGHQWFRLWMKAYTNGFERKEHRHIGWICARCEKRVDSIQRPQ